MTELDKKIIEEREIHGLTNKEIAEKYNLPKSYVAHRFQKSFREASERAIEKEKEYMNFGDEVEKLLPQSNSYNHLCSLLGLRGVDGYYKKIKKIIEERGLSTEHFGTIPVPRSGHGRNKFTKMTDEEYFIDNHIRSGKCTIQRLIDNGYKKYKCETCGLTEWMGNDISLQIHHINGKHDDNRLENLQILCPNCHSQTDTYAKNNCITKPKPSKETVKTEPKRKLNITGDEIIQALQELGSYESAGRKYKVSGNTIKKACKRLGIENEAQQYIISRKHKNGVYPKTNRKWVKKGKESKFVLIKEIEGYLNDGWEIGKYTESPFDYESIWKDWENGMRTSEIMRKYHCGQSTIKKIVKQYTTKNKLLK